MTLFKSYSPDEWEKNGDTYTLLANGPHTLQSGAILEGIWKVVIQPLTDEGGLHIGVINTSVIDETQHKTSWSFSTSASFVLKEGTVNTHGWEVTRKAANKPVQEGEQFAIELNLYNRTLHQYVDGKQQLHYICDVPRPAALVIGSMKAGDSFRVVSFEELPKKHDLPDGVAHPVGFRPMK
ncbi:hypothetical protein BLNAU_18697 [Blattamonas nauphoetae]|uniref:Uncharacterized protein n=1 Tax=Blattamonas nauphoetae TaxID=2049346 RepID=A0ABQ9X3J2_9EUKA|nr:hypothetical protein BLNAU_18697 [Blattamonas nauphoetae]